MDLVLKAMNFARERHGTQVRKYTGLPYWTHLAEVAGILTSSLDWLDDVELPEVLATAWLHDTVEDTGTQINEILAEFGEEVAYGVVILTDPALSVGNRAKRQELQRLKLSEAPAWVQTIKYADNISNTSSIVQYDPEFAKLYLQEKRAALELMTRGHPGLRALALQQVV